LSTVSLLILIVAALLTSTISGMTGMGGGTILLAVIATLVDTAYVVPLHGTVQLISNSTRLLLFFKHIKLRIVLFFLAGVTPGAMLGIYVFGLLDKDIVKLLMGLFILTVTYLPKRKKKAALSFRLFVPVGFVAGLIGIFFGAIGPFIATFFVRNDVSKEELVATKAACQAVTHLLKILLFGFIGINIFAHWQILLYLCLAVIAGTILGKKILHKISDQVFRKIFKIILTLIALRIVVLQVIKLVNLY